MGEEVIDEESAVGSALSLVSNSGDSVAVVVEFGGRKNGGKEGCDRVEERQGSVSVRDDDVRLLHRNGTNAVEREERIRCFDSYPKMRSVSRLLPRAGRAFQLTPTLSAYALPTCSPVFGLKPVSFLQSANSPSCAALRLTLRCCSTPRSFHSSSHALAVETIKVPAMSESISEGTLKQWLKKKGDYVELDEEIATIETDKVRPPLSPFPDLLTDFYSTSD